MSRRHVLIALGSAALAALFLACAAAGLGAFLLAGRGGNPGHRGHGPPPGNKDFDPPPVEQGADPEPARARLGPAAPSDHTGDPRTEEEKVVAMAVLCAAVDSTDDGEEAWTRRGQLYTKKLRWPERPRGGRRMLKDVEFLAWGPHDLKGETVNVMKADRYLVVRVRYRYQRAGEPAVEKDELYKLQRDIYRQVAPDEIVPMLMIVDFNLNDHGLRGDNPDGGAWLEKALAAKRAREGR
jgi:hypothetical protein